jgi:hypothetical protein
MFKEPVPQWLRQFWPALWPVFFRLILTGRLKNLENPCSIQVIIFAHMADLIRFLSADMGFPMFL